jgi:glycosyltransferase involved in cell wall biosynthesis
VLYITITHNSYYPCVTKPFNLKISLMKLSLQKQSEGTLSHSERWPEQIEKFEPASISIIIPAYNEEMRIGTGLTRTISFCNLAGWDYEIIIAAEGSKDKTVEIIQEKVGDISQIKVITGDKRLGKGGSIKNATRLVSKDYLAYMDVDLSADPSEFNRLLFHAQDCDIVIGSRILRGNLAPVRRPVSRALFSHMYSASFRLLFRSSIRDPQCGFKIFRREFAETLFKKVKTDGFAFDTEVVARAIKLGGRIKEVPILWRHEVYSKINIPQQVILMGKDLLSIRYQMIREPRTASSDPTFE